MKRLSFAFLAVLVTLLGQVQSVALPTSESTNSPPSNTVSLAHQGYTNTRTGTTTRGDPWKISQHHTYTSSISRGKPWKPEYTSFEHSLAGHPRGEGQVNSVPFTPDSLEPPIRSSDSNFWFATSVHHTGFVISTYHPRLTGSYRAFLTGSTHPGHCKDRFCREVRDYDHPTQANSWTSSERTHPTEHTRHTNRVKKTQTHSWINSEHTRHSDHIRSTEHPTEQTHPTENPTEHTRPNEQPTENTRSTEHTHHTNRAEHTQTHSLTHSEHSRTTGRTAKHSDGHTRPTERAHHTNRAEHTQTHSSTYSKLTHHTGHTHYTKLSHYIKHTRHTARAEHIHTTHHTSGMGRPSHTHSWTGSERSPHTSRPEHSRLTRHLSDTRNPSRLTITDGIHPTTVEIKAVTARADDGSIGILPCPKDYTDTCPVGQQCASVSGFEFDFLVCYPEKNTTTVKNNADVASGSGPAYCTPTTIFLEPFGNHDVNITYLGCATPFKPHFYTNGTCLCELLLNLSNVSPDMTVASRLRGETTTPGPHQTRAARDVAYPPFEANITGPCRVEEKIDLPDSWNGGDMIYNGTRYICMTGSLPIVFLNGTCECIERSTTFPTEYGGPGKTLKTSHTAFFTSYVTRQGTEVTASTSVNAGSFPFNPSATVMPITITEGSLVLEPTLFPSGIDIGPTSISEVSKRENAIPASASCPPDFQIVNAEHQKPSSNDCPIIVQVLTHQRWGNMSIAYPSLDEFCHLLHDPRRPYLPFSINLQPIIKQFCQGIDGIEKRGLHFPPIPTATAGNPFQTINSTHPKPSSGAKGVDIEIYVGEGVNKGVDTSPHYVTIFYADGLDAFCLFLKEGSDEVVKDRLPQGADKKQVMAEYCKNNRHYKRDTTPTKTTTYSYEMINSASPTPTSDKDSVCIQILTGSEPTGDNQSQPVYITPCYEIGLRDFCYWTSIWHANHKTANWDNPGNIKQVLAEYCSQYM